MADQLVTVTDVFVAADRTPLRGAVFFAPIVSAVDEDPQRAVVTRATVRAELDATGAFTAEVTASDDDGWRTDGPVAYCITVTVTGLQREYTALIPGPGPWRLTDLVKLDAPPDVAVVPTPGAPGPPPTLVDGTTTTLPPGSPATLDVVPTGVPGEYRVDAGLPAGEAGDDSTEPGPPGPPPTLVDGLTQTLPPGSDATSGVRPTGVPGEYAIDVGVPEGLAGEPGADGTLILSGQGEPPGPLGQVGDYYVDLADEILWGPKAPGGWAPAVRGYTQAHADEKVDRLSGVAEYSLTVVAGPEQSGARVELDADVVDGLAPPVGVVFDRQGRAIEALVDGSLGATDGHRGLVPFRVGEPDSPSDAVTAGFVASRFLTPAAGDLRYERRLLSQAVGRWQADSVRADGLALTDLSGGGRDAVFGVGAAAPTVLPYGGEPYLSLAGSASNYVSHTTALDWATSVTVEQDLDLSANQENHTIWNSAGYWAFSLRAMWASGACTLSYFYPGSSAQATGVVLTPGRFTLKFRATATGWEVWINGVSKATGVHSFVKATPGWIQAAGTGGVQAATRDRFYRVTCTFDDAAPQFICDPRNVNTSTYATIANTGSAGGVWAITRAASGYKTVVVDRPIVGFGGGQTMAAATALPGGGTRLRSRRAFGSGGTIGVVQTVHDGSAPSLSGITEELIGEVIFDRILTAAEVTQVSQELLGIPHASQPDPHPGYSLASSATVRRIGEWETVATWSALPASGNWPGRRIKVSDGLGLCVAVWTGAAWVVAPESDTGYQNLTLLNGWTAAPTYRIRRLGSQVFVEIDFLTGTAATSGTFVALPTGWATAVPQNKLIGVSTSAFPSMLVTISTSITVTGAYTSIASGRFAESWLTVAAWPTSAPA